MPVSGHPNVVVFLTDQQRWDTTGVHGCLMGLTPNFDRAAATPRSRRRVAYSLLK
jgi:arylsulfatase A-like enzyme